jgi:SAM-dependent methyltransferase
MDGFERATYGERIASAYDRLDTHGGVDPLVGGPDETAELLATLAGDGPALELAIGTGRIALPLARRGVEVTGIDISPAMVEQLRAKPGGLDIPVVIGDFADVAVEGEFALIYLVFNTLFVLPSADEQQRCFANVAARLSPGGVFVVEAFVPDLDRFVHDQNLQVRAIAVDEVFLDASIHHPDDQRVECQHIVIRSDGVNLYPVTLHYAWPEQIDDMAQRAGLRLRARYADWRRAPFTDQSGFHISVYERA